jgi:exonuclease I
MLDFLKFDDRKTRFLVYRLAYDPVSNPFRHQDFALIAMMRPWGDVSSLGVV